MHSFHTGFDFLGTFYAPEAGAYAQIYVSIRLLCIVSTPVSIFHGTFYAQEAGAYVQISVSI